MVPTTEFFFGPSCLLVVQRQVSPLASVQHNDSHLPFQSIFKDSCYKMNYHAVLEIDIIFFKKHCFVSRTSFLKPFFPWICAVCPPIASCCQLQPVSSNSLVIPWQSPSHSKPISLQHPHFLWLDTLLQLLSLGMGEDLSLGWSNHLDLFAAGKCFHYICSSFTPPKALPLEEWLRSARAVKGDGHMDRLQSPSHQDAGENNVTPN